MKKIIFLTFWCGMLFSPLCAQIKVGNQATNPDYMLDIEGKIAVRDKIYVGGSDVSLGDPGKEGQVLVSQGPGLPPRWRTLNLPIVEEEFFYLIYNNSFTDYSESAPASAGITLTSNQTSNAIYTIGTPRGNSVFNNFKTIEGLRKSFEVFSNDNQVYVTFEAVAHINSTATNHGVDFSCGIFVGETRQTRTLRAIRRTTLQQIGTATSPFITFTQINVIDNLTIGTYDIEIACGRNMNHGNQNSIFSGDLSIGNAIYTNINTFNAQTSLKVEVYEAPTQFDDLF